ncbi:MAG: RICIN domain-containing protein, partial [Desulfosarcina sp.]|nr:RICIN domain-containing protein [Desulfobacterales bacterium]
DRVRLYHDGREVKGRSQLPNGELGFPTSLMGGFKSQHSKSATYELVAENNQGKASKSIVVPAVGVKPPPSPLPEIISFRAIPSPVEAGKDVRFYWEVKGAETVRIYDDYGEMEGRIQLDNGTFGWPLTMPGAFMTSQKKTATYKLVAENREGKKTIKTFTVRVKNPQLRGTYTIQQKSNGRFLDAHEGSNDNSVVTRKKQGNTSQVWIFIPVGKNRYTIQQKSSRRYMDAHEGSNDNSVVTRKKQGNTSQVWVLRPLGKETYTIQQMSAGRYMDAHEGSNDNSVVTRNNQGNDTQRWIIKPL